VNWQTSVVLSQLQVIKTNEKEGNLVKNYVNPSGIEWNNSKHAIEFWGSNYQL